VRGFLLICFEAKKYNFIVRLKSKYEYAAVAGSLFTLYELFLIT